MAFILSHCFLSAYLCRTFKLVTSVVNKKLAIDCKGITITSKIMLGITLFLQRHLYISLHSHSAFV